MILSILRTLSHLPLISSLTFILKKVACYVTASSQTTLKPSVLKPRRLRHIRARRQRPTVSITCRRYQGIGVSEETVLT
jgi:hypothetical protein